MTTRSVFLVLVGDRCASTGDHEGHLGVTYLRPNLPDVVSSGYGCTLALMVYPTLLAFGVDKGHVRVALFGRRSGCCSE